MLARDGVPRSPAARRVAGNKDEQRRMREGDRNGEDAKETREDSKAEEWSARDRKEGYDDRRRQEATTPRGWEEQRTSGGAGDDYATFK